MPGTEERKTALRYNGHGNNFKFGAARFFVTPNFADTYNLLVLQLHEGPGKRSRLDIRGAAVVGAGGITSTAPIMFPLESIHQIVATDPRAQATLFLLMTELHYRLIQDLERLHVGRVPSLVLALLSLGQLQAVLPRCSDIKLKTSAREVVNRWPWLLASLTVVLPLLGLGQHRKLDPWLLPPVVLVLLSLGLCSHVYQ